MSLNDIPRGQLSTIILSVLIESDKYGFEILSEIKQKSNGSIIIKQPTLYSALSRMEKQGLITSYWKDGNLGGRRHYYQLTDLGKTQVSNLDKVIISQNSKPTTEIMQNVESTTIKNESQIEIKPNSETNAIPQQSTFLDSSIIKIQTGKPENENLNQINIFENGIDLTKKKFNIDAEINLCKPENQSFAEIVKSKSSKILSVNSEIINQNNDVYIYDELNIPNSTNNNMQAISIETPQNIDNQNTLNENEKQIDGNEGGVFVTEKYKPDELPKVRKLNPLRINEKDEKLSINLKPNHEFGHTEMINKLYKKSTHKNCSAISATAPTYEELKNYYNDINVKFSTYKPQKTDNDALPSKFIDYYKASLNKFLILFLLITIESIGAYLIFNYLNLPISYSELYFIIPGIFLIIPIHYFIKILNGKTRIISELKISPIWIDLLIIIVGFVLIYSFNMLLGLTYLNISEFATTFIYPSILLLNIIVIYFLNRIIFKNIKLKKY